MNSLGVPLYSKSAGAVSVKFASSKAAGRMVKDWIFEPLQFGSEEEAVT